MPKSRNNPGQSTSPGQPGTDHQPSPHEQAVQSRLDAVRRNRVRKTPDLGLGFLADQFKRDVEKPHKQLANLVPIWESMVPPHLLPHARLESIARGTLNITVQGSANLYELDRLLRSGLQQQLIRGQRGAQVRKVKLSLGVVDPVPTDGF